MVNELFTVEFWLAQAAISAPVVVMLVVGMVICYRQRRRRPRVSKLIGWALFAKLAWVMVGTPLFFLAVDWVEATSPVKREGFEANSMLIRIILYNLPSSTIDAAIWGTVLWAVLQVDDVREESACV